MSQDPNRAEEQAQRDRMPGLDVVLEAVVVHLPALQIQTHLLRRSLALIAELVLVSVFSGA
jgi:hypothetical protein